MVWDNLHTDCILKKMFKNWTSNSPVSIAAKELTFLFNILSQRICWIEFLLYSNYFAGNNLEKGLRNIGRQDIVVQCIKNVEVVTDDLEVAVAKVQLDQSGFDTLRDELSPSLDNSIKQDTSAEYDYPVCKSNSNVSVEHNLGGSIDNENNVAVKINNANNQMV